jgi:alpha-acetolactate decarboxylase
VFELGPGSGTLAGFWSPSYLGSALTVPGFHLHYLSGGWVGAMRATHAGCIRSP